MNQEVQKEKTTTVSVPLTGSTVSLSESSSTIPAGTYSSAIQLTTLEPDLISSNIRAGAVLFGITGTASVVNTSSGDAVAGEIFSGRKAWVNGVEVTITDCP